MSGILSKINIENLNQEEIDYNEIISDYELRLNNSGILATESGRYKSTGEFSSNKWIIYNENTHTHRILHFEDIYDGVRMKRIDELSFLVLKCFMADKLLSRRISADKLPYLIEIFKETEGFKPKLIKSKKGNAITTFLDYSSSDVIKESKLFLLKSYVTFLSELNILEESHGVILSSTSRYKIKGRENKSRSLPSNSDIFKFDFCIKHFFKNDSNPYLKKIYYPLWIWWKVTNVIPMRASELASKVKRDCLVIEDDKYYLKIDRVKVKRTESNKNSARIPILDRIQITKDIYDIIKEYIEFTDFEESETLFSWKAMVAFKEKYVEEKPKFYTDSDEFANFNINTNSKFNELVFNRYDLNTLLDSFYNQILAPMYNYHCDKKNQFTAGDTRHLAFCNLILQGLSPVEIAMMGGHTTLEMQDSYTNHVEYYIDNETLNYLSDKSIDSDNQKMFRNLKEIIFNKKWSYDLGVDISDYELADDGIGYCLLDINNPQSGFCEEVLHCAFCSKWWCEPTNENYVKLKKQIIESEISPLRQTIISEENFFINLLKQARLVNVNNILEIDKIDEQEIKSQAMKLRAKADKLAFLQASVAELNSQNSITQNDK